LFQTNNNLSTSFQRQSSGNRINSAADDAAGLVISNQLSSEIVSQNAGIRNANDGISISQVSEGALQEASSILLRARELALASSSGQNSDEGRAALNAEFQQLGQELSRISSSTVFGGQTLLDGGNQFDVQVGEDAGQTISVQTPDVSNIGSAISSSISNLQNAAENVSVSRSRIKDSDFASEASNSAKNSILQGANVAVLAQANLSNQSALYLLK